MHTSLKFDASINKDLSKKFTKNKKTDRRKHGRTDMIEIL